MSNMNSYYLSYSEISSWNMCEYLTDFPPPCLLLLLNNNTKEKCHAKQMCKLSEDLNLQRFMVKNCTCASPISSKILGHKYQITYCY